MVTTCDWKCGVLRIGSPELRTWKGMQKICEKKKVSKQICKHRRSYTSANTRRLKGIPRSLSPIANPGINTFMQANFVRATLRRDFGKFSSDGNLILFLRWTATGGAWCQIKVDLASEASTRCRRGRERICILDVVGAQYLPRVGDSTRVKMKEMSEENGIRTVLYDGTVGVMSFLQVRNVERDGDRMERIRKLNLKYPCSFSSLINATSSWGGIRVLGGISM